MVAQKPRKLTDILLKSLPKKPAAAGDRDEYPDAHPLGRGIYARVTDKGAVSLTLKARYPRNPKHPTHRSLGAYPSEIGLSAARDKALEWRQLIKRGVDPKDEEQRKSDEAEKGTKGLFENVAADFARLRLVGDLKKQGGEPLLRTGMQTAREIDAHYTGRFRGRHMASIREEEILEIVYELIDRGLSANHVHNMYGHCRRLFRFAVGRRDYGIAHSPIRDVSPREMIGRRRRGERTLTNAEWRAFWQATGEMGYPFGDLFRLLAITGQRLREIGDAQWGEIEDGVLSIPPERMKSKARHTVPMPPDALAILDGVPRMKGGGFIFSTMRGKRPVSGYSRAKTILDRKMLAVMKKAAEEVGDDPDAVSLPAFTLHDIRRSMRTHLSTLPIADVVREVVIAHRLPELHQVYDQHAYADEKAEALRLWSAKLRGIVNPPKSNVIQLQARA